MVYDYQAFLFQTEGNWGELYTIIPGEGNGNPLQYSCQENPMNRGAWRAPSMGSQRVGRNPVTIHAHIHPNGQSRKHLGTGNLHHTALAPARPGSEGPKATVSEVTAAEVEKDNHLAPGNNQECQTLFEGESDPPFHVHLIGVPPPAS